MPLHFRKIYRVSAVAVPCAKAAVAAQRVLLELARGARPRDEPGPRLSSPPPPASEVGEKGGEPAGGAGENFALLPLLQRCPEPWRPDTPRPIT